MKIGWFDRSGWFDGGIAGAFFLPLTHAGMLPTNPVSWFEVSTHMLSLIIILLLTRQYLPIKKEWNSLRFISGSLLMLVLWSLLQLVDTFKHDYNSWGLRDETPAFNFNQNNKVRGVHYFTRFKDGNINFDKIKESNIKQLVLVPYAYQTAYNSTELNFRQNRRRRSIDRDSMYLSLAQIAASEGLEIIIKPHIWMPTDHGKWRSDIQFSNKDEFQRWAEKYADFILHYAALSEEMGASHFCIGTELSGLTKGHDEFWIELIREVRKIYHGKIFYAANWYREYEQIQFWGALDYIGIQAYFPICKKNNPSIDDLKKGWKTYRMHLKKTSIKFHKPILFSELGYRSSDDAAIDPWAWVEGERVMNMKVSEETQANCYEAFFETFWDEPWFAGALI
ncbi:MAG: hypothetical protein KDC53_08900, partial [Saprospiraceae bacterium]|nr:hypothetical protein [Saprospiraceae bacterium]